MDKTGKFLLPSPKFKELDKPSAPTPHFLSPQGMLLPKDKQPPPMYGPRGATVPPKFLGPQQVPNTSSSVESAQKYFCEPCEAEFHTSTDYKVHRSEHTQCEIDNCSFRGHPSFMDTHIGQQHATGLYDQLKKLSTPEEIAQWRTDRKKNYPTVASVEQKWKAREQRMLRGEKLQGNANRFGRQADRRQMRGDKQKEMGDNSDKSESRKRQRKRKRVGKQGAQGENKKREIVEKAPMEVPENEEPTCGGLKMFKGTGGMAGYRKVKKVEAHALSSLLGMYGSDSEDDDEEEEKIEEANQSTEQKAEETTESENIKEESLEKDVSPESNASDNVPLKKVVPSNQAIKIDNEKTEGDEPNKLAEPHSSDDEAPEESPIEKSSHIPDRPQSEIPKKKLKQDPPKRKMPKSGLDYRKLRGGRQNTMLEKLLEPDIRHERNVLLQCVRFVVENKFFGIGSSSSQSQS